MLKMLKSPPLALGIEEVKRLNMVDFLSRHYGLDFSKTGRALFFEGR